MHNGILDTPSTCTHVMQVTDSGGAQQVIRDKHWRDVGDAFHLPKTITSLSYVLKRGYMQYLWDYEQVSMPPNPCSCGSMLHRGPPVGWDA
jgi:hypothetical protein